MTSLRHKPKLEIIWMTCMSASTKASKFGLQVSFQSLWSSLPPLYTGVSGRAHGTGKLAVNPTEVSASQPMNDLKFPPITTWYANRKNRYFMLKSYQMQFLPVKQPLWSTKLLGCGSQFSPPSV